MVITHFFHKYLVQARLPQVEGHNLHSCAYKPCKKTVCLLLAVHLQLIFVFFSGNDTSTRLGYVLRRILLSLKLQVYSAVALFNCIKISLKNRFTSVKKHKVLIRCAGPDGEYNTEDDILNFEPKTK